MRTNLEYQRRNSPSDSGRFGTHTLDNTDEHASLLEMLDILNEELFDEGKEPLTSDSDCREGICGQYGIAINGDPHGPRRTTTCQLHMRTFKDDGTTILEPWRSKGFPVIRDLVMNRSVFDRIIQAGGYISVNTGAAPGAHLRFVPKGDADRSLRAATYIGCGACVVACPNGSAILFTSARVIHLGLLPQGQPEHRDKVINMLAQQDNEGFGGCTNVGACASVCPKEIPLELISLFNRGLIKSYGHRAYQE